MLEPVADARTSVQMHIHTNEDEHFITTLRSHHAVAEKQLSPFE